MQSETVLNYSQQCGSRYVISRIGIAKSANTSAPLQYMRITKMVAQTMCDTELTSKNASYTMQIAVKWNFAL